MKTTVRLFATTAAACFATGALAGPPGTDGLSGGRSLRVPSAKHAALSRRVIADGLQAAQGAASIQIDSHIRQWVTFDVPQAGPIGTYPSAINDVGEIAGNYNDATAAQAQHGFLRSADGALVSFDPPGSQLTNPNGLNNLGTVVGYYVDAEGNVHGFARTRRGQFARIDPPGTVGDASVWAIDDAGVMTGHYYDAEGFAHAFVREPDGTFVSFAPPASANSVYINCAHINLEGEVGCQYADTNSTWHGLLRYSDGRMMTYDAPRAGIGSDLGTFVGFIQSLNVLGDITGEYADINNGYHGYVRDIRGRFVEFTVAGGGTNNANGTYPAALNIWGTVTGFSYDANGFATGFVRFANGTIDSFQAPALGNLGTYPYGNNVSDQFTGFFVDASGTGHGFVALATP